MGPPVLLRHPSSSAFRQDASHPDAGGLHPERPERIAAVEAELAQRGWLGYERREAPGADLDAILAVHPRAYVERLAAAAGGAGTAREETVVSVGSLEAARHGVGGACALAELLLAGEAPAGFALLRPPGHHADGTTPKGFCLLNAVAIAAQHALDALGAARVFVLDWDVHHGNGTMDAFRRSDRVLFASVHQEDLFPGTGPLHDVGGGAGRGYSINAPLPAGTDPDTWLAVVEHVIVPAAEGFDPALILVSAGFDAHRDDPVARSLLDEESFAELARQVRDLGRRVGAPVGAVLEGGYEPAVLGACVAATMAALAGEGTAGSVAPDPIHTRRVASEVGHFWAL